MGGSLNPGHFPTVVKSHMTPRFAINVQYQEAQQKDSIWKYCAHDSALSLPSA